MSKFVKGDPRINRKGPPRGPRQKKIPDQAKLDEAMLVNAELAIAKIRKFIKEANDLNPSVAKLLTWTAEYAKNSDNKALKEELENLKKEIQAISNGDTKKTPTTSGGNVAQFSTKAITK